MKVKFLIMAAVCALFASCMGDSYAETDESVVPFGNNNLTETNVVSIAELKKMFATEIATSYGFKKVDNDLKIKGIVTSTDVEGNVYNEVALQDETGAIIISVAQNGIYGYLPVGTEVLVDLKDLYVGNYGLQPQIGVPSMNAAGTTTSIGRISRATWDKHYKILSTGHDVQPEVFADGAAATTWNLNEDAGKLGIIKNVTLKNSSPVVDSTYANAKGGAGSVKWYFKEQNSNVFLYNSNYADFANAKIPNGKVDITGIIKRFNNQWEIIIRTLDDIKPAAPEVTAIYANSMAAEPTDWTYEQGTLDPAISYVWKWASPAYGMKASAYVGGARYETHARVTSPQINLTGVTHATLSFDQAARYFSDFNSELKVQVSTDKTNWKDLTLDQVPTGADWNFITSKADLTPYCGSKVYISFYYNSTTTTAATWEFKNVEVK